MMNQLKFRAWDKKCKAFLYATSYDPHLYSIPNGVNSVYDLSRIFSETNRFCVDRFTGIRDINGVEVYEGDIIEVTDSDCLEFSFDIINKGEVIWDYCSFGVVLKDAKGLREFNNLYYLWEHGKIRVVGNKYE